MIRDLLGKKIEKGDTVMVALDQVCEMIPGRLVSGEVIEAGEVVKPGPQGAPGVVNLTVIVKFNFGMPDIGARAPVVIVASPEEKSSIVTQ